MLRQLCPTIVLVVMVTTCSVVAAATPKQQHKSPAPTLDSKTSSDAKAPTSTDKFLVVSGDFSAQRSNDGPFKESACTRDKQCAVLVAADGTKVADANVVTIEQDQVWLCIHLKQAPQLRHSFSSAR